MGEANQMTLAEEISDRAAGHVTNARQTLDLEFDYSPQSLQLVDHVITKYHGNQALFDSTIVTYGAYIGETVRRALGGEWAQGENGVAELRKVGGDSVTVFPFAWAAKRFENGDVDLISFKYSALLNTLGRMAEDPPKLEFADGDDISGASEEESSDEPDDNRINADDASADEIIGRSPLLVFLLVAAADGEIDKKEIAQFQKVLATAAESESPLFRSVATAVIPKLAEYTARLTELGALGWLIELVRISAILEEHHPDEAQAFKESLYDIAVRVAESAGGGWFGLGGKISKQERDILEVMRKTFALSEK